MTIQKQNSNIKNMLNRAIMSKNVLKENIFNQNHAHTLPNQGIEIYRKTLQIHVKIAAFYHKA